MGIFEYIAVLTSLIIGLGLTHLLRGLVQIIQSRDKSFVYWVHLVWVIYFFINLVFWWWWEFRLGQLETWTFQLYFFVVTYALVQFIVCALMFPPSLEDYDGFEDYFFANRRYIFGFQALSFVLDLIDTRIKGAEYFASLGNEYLLITGLEICLMLTAAWTSNRRYHATLVVAMFLYQLSWALRAYETVA